MKTLSTHIVTVGSRHKNIIQKQTAYLTNDSSGMSLVHIEKVNPVINRLQKKVTHVTEQKSYKILATAVLNMLIIY